MARFVLRPGMVSSNQPPKPDAASVDSSRGSSSHERQRKLLDALQSGDLARARTLAEALTQHAPRLGLGWKIFGLILYAEGSITDGIAAMRLSLQLLPMDAEAHCNLGFALGQLQRFEEAEIYLNRAINIDAGFSLAHYRLGMINFMQGNLAKAQTHLSQGLALRSNYADQDTQNHSNLLFVLAHDPGVSGAYLREAVLRFGEEVERPLRPSWPEHANDRDPERRLRVGFVAGKLHDDPWGNFPAPVLARLAAFQDLDLHVYNSNPNNGGFGDPLKGLFKNWVDVDALSDEALAARVISDRIDILIDLSGHNGRNRLPAFARKPAPVQLSGFGYPGTTGIAAIDYYLADPHWLTPGRFDVLFTEKLIYLPDVRPVEPLDAAAPAGPLPAIARGHLTFGSLNRLCKINSDTVRLWSKVLLALPDAVLLLMGIPERQQSGLVASFGVHGIDPARITMCDRQTPESYTECLNQVDIVLDTLAYSGSATTMYALSMGIPTLTLRGTTPQARISAGILDHLGLDAFVADDEDDFISRARDWSSCLNKLAAVRADLRVQENQAGQPHMLAAHFHVALRQVWRLWCQGLEPHSFQTELPTPIPSSDTHLDILCALGTEHQLAGRLEAAEKLYCEVLAAAQQHGRANYCLGTLRLQQKRTHDGLKHLQTALLARLDVVDYWLGYVEALVSVGQGDAARSIVNLAMERRLPPDMLEALERRLELPVADSPAAPSTPSITEPTRKLSRAERKRARTAELLAERRKARSDRTATPAGRGS